MPSQAPRALVVWRLIDGKPGHEKQSLGLANALIRVCSGEVHDIPSRRGWKHALLWLLRRFPPGDGLPPPDIILGAGHATHLAMLAARRAHGGRSVVLMKPSLPLGLFDLCIIPEHDRPPRRANVIATLGVLNAVTPPLGKPPGRGLILLGGLSRHYRWNDSALAGMVLEIVHASPDIDWRLTTSRRTPESFFSSLPEPLPINLEIMPHDRTSPGWLEQQLAQASQAWVTEDSVSMLYEAITAGAAVGLLNLDRRGTSRVRQGVERLIAQGRVTPFGAWRQHRVLSCPEGPLDEAARAAGLILRAFRSRETIT